MPSTTVTYSASDGTRIAHAVGVKLNLGRDATVNEVKALIVAAIKQMVLESEQREVYLAINVDTLSLT